MGPAPGITGRGPGLLNRGGGKGRWAEKKSPPLVYQRPPPQEKGGLGLPVYMRRRLRLVGQKKEHPRQPGMLC